jgi:hypothetical protein
MHRLADLVTGQAAFDFWRPIYNEQRPHEGDRHGGAGEPL